MQVTTLISKHDEALAHGAVSEQDVQHLKEQISNQSTLARTTNLAANSVMVESPELWDQVRQQSCSLTPLIIHSPSTHHSFTIHSSLTHGSLTTHSPLIHHSLTIHASLLHHPLITHSWFTHHSLTTDSPFTHHPLTTRSWFTHHSLTTNSPFTHHLLTTHSPVICSPHIKLVFSQVFTHMPPAFFCQWFCFETC